MESGMDLAKVEALYREFPHLTKYLKKERVGRVLVQRIDADLLKEQADTFQGCRTGRIFLLDHDFNELIQVGIIKNTHKLKWYKPSTWIRLKDDLWETTGEALHRLGEGANNVHFIISFKMSVRHKFELTLHKPPKGFTLVSWLEKQNKSAHQELLSELNEIDTAARQ